MDEDELTEWKNWNSFVARLTSPTFSPWLNLPIWQFRDALENETVRGPAMECQLWVATEWITQCAGVIFEFVSEVRELDERTARAYRTDPLCEEGVGPLSVERWAFWRRRLQELAGGVEGLEVDGAIVARITDALESMDAVESKDSAEIMDATESKDSAESKDATGSKDASESMDTAESMDATKSTGAAESMDAAKSTDAVEN